MLKVDESRSEELKAIGWPPEDVRRYEELWEYRQRWGAINLERDERLFLRKADSALPKLQAHGKAAKKATRDKSHYRWLEFYLDALKASPPETELGDGEQGAWPILLEEELRVLDYYEPVLGLPDTLKAKALIPLREQWAGQAAALGRTLSFDFQAPLEALKATTKTSWKPLRAEASDTGVSVRIARAAGSKCERCWHYESDVAEHQLSATVAGQICGRCRSTLEG